MSVLRTLLVLLGMVVAGVGVAVAATSTPVAEGAVAAAMALLGNDYLVVAVVAAVAVVLTLVVVAGRLLGGIHQFTPPDPEGVPSAHHPGVEFDRYVERPLGLRHLLGPDETEPVRDRLREAAIQTVMREANCPREAARRMVDRGTWTNDRAAAAYLGGPGAPAATWSSRVEAAVFGRSWHQWAARRAARDIVGRSARGRP